MANPPKKRDFKLPPEQLAQFAEAIHAELAKRRARAELSTRCADHLSDFIREAWGVIEPATPYIHGWHIDAICEHLEAVSKGQIKDLLINMPPRHMKSIAVSVMWPAWAWIKQPSLRWLFSSYAQSLSTRDSLKCRRLIDSPWYRNNWGDRFKLTSDQNQKIKFENDKTGFRLATSVDGSNTGEGADVIVADDPHNVRERESDDVREGVLDWWDNVMSTRRNSPKTSARVVVMQRVHERDVAGHILERGGYVHLCLPAEYEGNKFTTVIGWSDPRDKEGDLLWPERIGPKEIEDYKRDLGSRGYAGQFQQHPSPAEGGMFKRYWWRYWKPAGMTLPPVMVKNADGQFEAIEAVDLPSGFDENIQSWDMAFKDLKDSDYVVGQVWKRAGASKFLFHQVKERLDFPKTVSAVRAMTAAYPDTTGKLVEDKANGPAVISTLQDEIPGLIAVTPEGGKEARAAAVSPQVEAGNVFLPHPSLAPWVNDFIESCSAFPNGANDDDVDAFTQALLRLSKVQNRSAFTDFRPYGPRAGEAKEACHVIAPVTLAPWWNRWLSLSWGPQTAIHWYAQHQDGRIHVYREVVKDGISAEQAGALLAEKSAPEIEANKTLTAWVSPEFFEAGLGRKSVAMQISEGISKVLGPESAFLWQLTEEERMMDANEAMKSREARRARLRGAAIMLHGAKGEPAGGWEYLRSLLRWKPLQEASGVDYDRDFAKTLLMEPDGQARFREYMKTVKGGSNEVLPGIQIHDCCAELVRSISGATRNERDPGCPATPNAALLSALYGCIGHREGILGTEPLQAFVAKRLQNVQWEDGTSKFLVAQKAEADWRKMTMPQSFSFPRFSRRRVN